jgi:hypothetical protein
MKNQRNNNISKIPKERRKIRPNIEATIKEFKNKTKAGKLKVRGIFKTKLFAFAMGISINFGRIYRLIMSNNENFGNILTNFNGFIVQILIFLKLTQFPARKNKKSNHFSNFAFIRA